MSDHNEELNAATLASIYIKMRDAIKELEDQIKTIEEQKEVVANKILDICRDENADTIRTPFGTISRRLDSRYWTSDWDNFYKTIREHGAYHLLEKRIHNGNMKEFLAENPEAVPPGLQANQKYVISVRKPSGN